MPESGADWRSPGKMTLAAPEKPVPPGTAGIERFIRRTAAGSNIENLHAEMLSPRAFLKVALASANVNHGLPGRTWREVGLTLVSISSILLHLFPTHRCR